MSTIETPQMPGLDDDTRRLVDAVVKNIIAQGGTSRTIVLPPGAGTPAGTGEDQQRLFGNILSSLCSVVLPKVAPHFLALLQQRRRELGLPEQRDAQSVERDLQSILGALLPKLVEVIPGLVQTISGKPAPRSATEEGERFLPILGALIPAAVSAVGAIVGAFNQQRGADPTPPPITDPDVAQRFIGPLLSSIVPQLLQAASPIMSSIFGGRRDIADTTW